jgi:hypothetical protein
VDRPDTTRYMLHTAYTATHTKQHLNKYVVAELRMSAARSAATPSVGGGSVGVVAASGRQSGEVSCGGESAAIVTRPSGEGRTGDRGRWLG